MLDTITNESQNNRYLMILAHGAGAGMDHSFMSSIAVGLSAKNGTIIRFNFGYKSEGKKFPGSPAKSISDINEIVQLVKSEYPGLPIILAGKSYGGRMSSHWVEQNENGQVKALVYFGFPLHAPGRESMSRAEHLKNIRIPQLFLQGTNDKLADNELITQVTKDLKQTTVIRIEQADHGFKVPKSSGKSHQEILNELIETSNNWILDQL
ncbi:MAG: alpha/beta hydrolase [Marinoscillum sp.]